ncbi:MAG: hypothetical protein V7K89_25105 [Nostoc sp.]|uniref:hypothetical protein n=1 Tax=Nostoc sp. TaxID=1180 RepID=UPI002FF6C410
MEVNEVRDFADRIKKSYYCRADLCEKLISGNIGLEDHNIALPPQDYNPFRNLYIDSYIIGCTALDGLSYIHQVLNSSAKTKITHQDRFVSFLQYLNVQQYLERVSTPFLNYSLEKKGIEEPFRQEIKKIWINNKEDKWKGESHRIYCDPTIDEIKIVYEDCHEQNSIPPEITLKDINKTLKKFTYAALIYKFYRCSFVHEFRASEYTAIFNKGKQISIREFGSYMLPSGKIVVLDDVQPQLDVGIGVLTESIRKGASIAHDLIVQKQCITIPYDPNDEIKIETKAK